MPMQKTAFSLILALLIQLTVFAPICRSEMPSGNRTDLPAIDLSTPQKTVFYFYESFRIGNDRMLTAVLAPGAILPEFNPLQRIERPNPSVLGAEIKKVRVMDKETLYPNSNFAVKPGDVEVYVVVKIDPHIETNKSGIAMLDEMPCFLVRKIDKEWKIVAVFPFWPTVP